MDAHLLKLNASFLRAPLLSSLPEIIIPSADTFLRVSLSRSLKMLIAVLLPESFRGGCSFGVGTGPISPATALTL